MVWTNVISPVGSELCDRDVETTQLARMGRLRLFLILGISAIVGALGAYLLHRHLPPFAVGPGHLFIRLIALARHVWGTRTAIVVYYSAFIFLAIASAEIYLTVVPVVETLASGSDKPLEQFDRDLGYSILPESRIVRVVKSSAAGALIYDVNYTID